MSVKPKVKIISGYGYLFEYEEFYKALYAYFEKKGEVMSKMYSLTNLILLTKKENFFPNCHVEIAGDLRNGKIDESKVLLLVNDEAVIYSIQSDREMMNEINRISWRLDNLGMRLPKLLHHQYLRIT